MEQNLDVWTTSSSPPRRFLSVLPLRHRWFAFVHRHLHEQEQANHLFTIHVYVQYVSAEFGSFSGFLSCFFHIYGVWPGIINSLVNSFL